MGLMHARISRHPDYLDVELTGRLDLSELLELIKRLGAMTREQGDQRLLFDLLGLEGELHTAGQMQVGEWLVQCLPHLAGLASVVPTEKITRASENVARSHGIRMQVFDSREAALAWLRQAEPPAEPRGKLMGAAHAAIWDAMRHLFPRHAQAIELPNGTLAISWSVAHQAGSHYDMATPITVRLEPDLMQSLTLADAEQRKRIATHQEASFRAGLMGYDPYAAVPSARVIVLG